MFMYCVCLLMCLLWHLDVNPCLQGFCFKVPKVIMFIMSSLFVLLLDGVTGSIRSTKFCQGSNITGVFHSKNCTF